MQQLAFIGNEVWSLVYVEHRACVPPTSRAWLRSAIIEAVCALLTTNAGMLCLQAVASQLCVACAALLPQAIR